jgi:phosphate:Na+ symporter
MQNILLILGVPFLIYGFWLSNDFTGIAAGISIFLFGMLTLEQGFNAFTGGTLERILRKTTRTNWRSLWFGVLATSLMQSSSLVSIITISFISAGLLELAAGIGIIFGANLGTSTGAWLIAGLGLKVNLSEYALPLLVFGILFIFQGHKKLKGLGYILAGLGFLFLGIHYMKESFEAIKETLDLVEYAIPGIRGLLIYTLMGFAATIIMQSSHATMVLIITALAAHQITYENALALAIGSNVGTTVTAILGSLGANVEGKRLAGAHFLFNTITGGLALVLIKHFEACVDWIAQILTIAADNYTLKLAIFHSLFNLFGIILLFPFIDKLVKVLKKTIKPAKSNIFKPKYLTDSAAGFPETFVESVRLETIHLYENAIHIVLKTFGIHRRDLLDNESLWAALQKDSAGFYYDIDAGYEKRIKGIFSAIIEFISQATFSREMEQSSKLYWLRNSGRHIVEAIKDTKHMQKNWIRYGRSQSTEARDEYQKIAFQIALMIREIEQFRQKIAQNELPLLSLDSLKSKIEEDDTQVTRQIEKLIREKKITPQTGSSLINDSAYMYSIKSNLLKAAETLFMHKSPQMFRPELKLALDDSEIKMVIEKINPAYKQNSDLN